MPENRTTDIVVHGLCGEHYKGWAVYEDVHIQTDLRSWLRSNFFQDIEPADKMDYAAEIEANGKPYSFFAVTDLKTAEQTYWELIGDLE